MCNICEVVLQEYDLEMYKGNNLERGMYLDMVCFRHTVVYIFEDAGILILVSFCTIQKKKPVIQSPSRWKCLSFKAESKHFNLNYCFKSSAVEYGAKQTTKKCVNSQILLHRTVSRPKWLLCQWLCSWLGAETADSGSWQRVKAQRGRDKEPCGKRNSN